MLTNFANHFELSKLLPPLIARGMLPFISLVLILQISFFHTQDS